MKATALILIIATLSLMGCHTARVGTSSVVDNNTKTVELVKPGVSLVTLPEEKTCKGQVLKMDFANFLLTWTHCDPNPKSASPIIISVTDFSHLPENEKSDAIKNIKNDLAKLVSQNWAPAFKNCATNFEPNWVRIIRNDADGSETTLNYTRKEDACDQQSPATDDRIKGVVSNFDQVVAALMKEITVHYTGLTRGYSSSQYIPDVRPETLPAP